MYQITRVRYSHDAMIDLIIASPWIRQREVAAHFGMSEGWISQVFSSDVFKMRLNERKKELVDPTILLSIEEEFESVARLSMRIVRERLEATGNGDLAVQAMAVSAKALGFGARSAAPIAVQNNVVVMVPAKAASSADWSKNCIPAEPATKTA